MVLSEKEKRLRRINRMHAKYNTLTIGSVFNDRNVGLCTYAQTLARLSRADKHGWVTCISCGKRSQWNRGMQGGHFVGRSNKATAIEPDNIWPQCIDCNNFGSGMRAEYRAALTAKIGEKRVRELERMKLPNNHVWDRYEMATWADDIKEEIKFHKRRLGI